MKLLALIRKSSKYFRFYIHIRSFSKRNEAFHYEEGPAMHISGMIKVLP